MYDWDEYVRKAKELLSEKSKLLALLAEAFLKAGSCKEALRNSWDNLMALLRLVKAWARGEYRQIPWFSIVFAVAANLYFVNPFDLIPDAIPVVGYFDDAAVLGIAIAAIEEDFKAFIDWEKGI